jgi:AcrR family transcriptional regulator
MRHHYIPRFLQKGFASRFDNDKVWIWQIQMGKSPIEISTKDSGVSKKFYGDDDTLERAFGEYEQRFAPAIDEILYGKDPNEFSEVLSMFVWTQAIRTKAMRENFSTASHRLVDEIFAESSAHKLADHISSRVEREFDQLFAQAMLNLQPDERLVAEESYRVPIIRNLMMDAMRSQLSVSGVANMLSRLIITAQNSGVIADIVQKGSLAGFKKLLLGDEPLKVTTPNIWSIRKYDDHSLVLGDICTFYSGSDGSWGGAGKFGDAWKAVFLPIAHNTILVGTKSDNQFEITAEDANYLSSALSYEAIFSSRVSSTVEALRDKIGSLEPLLNTEEIADVVNQVWSSS